MALRLKARRRRLSPNMKERFKLAFNVVTAEFSANRVGYSSAYAVVMLVLVAALAIVILRYLQRCEQRI